MKDFITNYHGIEERLKAKAEGITFLFAKPSKRNLALKDLAKSKGVEIAEITESELERLTGDADHRGIAIEVPRDHTPAEVTFEDFIKRFDKETALVLILDGLTDPQNFGAILRSADKFGVDLVVIPARRSVRETDAVASASAGATNYVKIATVTNLTRTLEQLKDKGFWIYGADMGGQRIEDSNMTGKVALVLGSEGAGMSRLVKETCDFVVSITTTGHVDSLNVSVAAGIFMYEIRRQQKFFS